MAAPPNSRPAVLAAAALGLTALAAWLLWPATDVAAPATAGADPIAATAASDTAPPLMIAPPPVRATALPPQGMTFVACDARKLTSLAGTTLHRLDNGELLATADASGRCRVEALPDVELVAVAAGHLLRLCPRAAAGADPPRLLLQPDDRSMRLRLGCRDAAGQPLASIALRLRRLADASAAAATAPPPRRAFIEHDMLSALPQFGFANVMSSRSDVVTWQVPLPTELRVCAPASYELQVATAGGLVASTRVELRPGPPTVIDLQLSPGIFASGVATRADTAEPLAGARVQVDGGDPLALSVATAADGSFRIGPLPAGATMLTVACAGQQTARLEVPGAGFDALRAALRALPPNTLRGRVLARASDMPVTAARIESIDAQGSACSANCDAQGGFELPVATTGPLRITIAAPGFLDRVETLSPDAQPLHCELWPADTAARLANGATGVVRGMALDLQGQPIAGVAVRWQPDQQGAKAAVSPGRPPLPPLATTDADGRFAIETDAFGRGQVQLLRGTLPPITLRTTVTAGRAGEELCLHQSGND